MDVDSKLELAAWHQDAGRLNDAQTLYLQILDEEREPYALYFMGLIKHTQGHPELALPLLREAVELDAECAEFWCGLGGTLQALGQSADAIEAYRRGIDLDPRLPGIYLGYGNALASARRFDEAAAAYRLQIELTPDNPQVHNNLASALQDKGNFAEAAAVYSRALEIDPLFPEAHNNRGLALHAQSKLADAEAEYRKAIVCNPEFAEAHANLGTCLYHQRRIPEAIAAYSQALGFAPGLAKAHFSLSLALLLLGDFERGWRMFEWRWKCQELKLPQPFMSPPWDGRPLAAQTILLQAEQGFGDSIQFIRYAPLVAARGGRVLLECPPALERLLRCVAGVTQVIPRGQPLPAFDTHCPMMSLPLAFGTRVETIPDRVPYLFADPALQKKWALKLSARPGELTVGLTWAGSVNPHPNDRNRSIPLSQLAPLAAVKGVRFVSLQTGAPRREMADVPSLEIDEPGELGDFADTAALIAQLDLVITIDTAVAHLAGAMGRPVWVLLPRAADWRWTLDGEQTPWYPTARLFRQSASRDWAQVVPRIVVALEGLRASTP